MPLPPDTLTAAGGENCLIAGTSHQETEGGGDQSKPFYDLLQNPTLLVRIYFTSSLERYIHLYKLSRRQAHRKFLRERQQQQTRDKF